VEVGWGDRDYYPAPGFNVWYAFKAVAWPTPSVLHVTGFDDPPRMRPSGLLICKKEKAEILSGHPGDAGVPFFCPDRAGDVQHPESTGCGAQGTSGRGAPGHE